MSEYTNIGNKDLATIISQGTEFPADKSAKRGYKLTCVLSFDTTLDRIENCKAQFNTSNEPYFRWHKVNDKIKETKGIERAVLICGGGDQNIFLLSLLENKNSLEKVDVIDKNREQLLNLAKLIGCYNRADLGCSYLPAIDSQRKKMPLSYDTKLHLRDVDFVNYIGKLARQKGSHKYFIYASNAPELYPGSSMWIPYELSQKLFRVIGKSSHFEEGTLVLVLNGCLEPHLLMKSDNKLEEIASFTSIISRHVKYSRGRYYMSDCEHPFRKL